MSKSKLFSKLLPIVLIVSLFSTACDVPDISKFTEESAEMTRGIRKGIKDNESLIKTASEREDLYSPETIAKLKENLKQYKTAIKPTVAALDALDAYLDALNALAQANKKSGENAGAAVTSVTNLVTAVTGFAVADSVVSIATGLVTLAEQFRTSRDFRKRVTLAAEIVEGVHPVLDENGNPKKDKDGRVIFVSACTEDAKKPISEAGDTIKKIAEPALKSLDKAQAKLLKDVPADKKWETLHSWGKLNDADFKKIHDAEQTVDRYGCGVIDFIKFNVQDLQVINENVSRSLLDNIREKDSTVFGLHDSLIKRRKIIQEEFEQIQIAQNLVPTINQYRTLGADPEVITSREITFKQTLDTIFDQDTPLKNTILKSLEKCDETTCGKILDLLKKDTSFGNCDNTCRTAFKNAVSNVTREQFDSSAAIILPILDTRRNELSDEEESKRAHLERLDPQYKAVVAEIAAIKGKRDQLDALLDSSMSALDSWAEAHANLRVAVNTKKPLSVAKLASKVREIWAIVNA